MLKNYFKVGWRTLVKYRRYSSINLFGLSPGLGATLLLFMIINYENSYDKFHSNYLDIFLVTYKTDGGITDRIVTSQAPPMKDEYSDVIAFARFFEG